MHHPGRIGALSLSTGGTGQLGSAGSGGADGTPGTPGDCLRIAGWTVVLEVPDAGLRGSLSRAFSRFRVPGTEAASRVEVVAPGTPRPAPAVREIPQVHLEADGSLRVRGEDYSARITADGARATVEGQVSFAVETVLKVMLARELARRGGLLVHGVAVAHQGRAALFVGHSGAGKSTLGALWSGAGGTLLSDELVAVWPGASGWRAAGTPWNVGVPEEASLRAVGTLAWDTGSRWEAQGAGEVGRLLLPNSLLPEATALGRGGVLMAAGRLLSAVEPVRLVFARDASAAHVIREALEARGHG